MSLVEQIPFLNTLPEEMQLLVLNLMLLVFALIAMWILRNAVARLFMLPLRNIATKTETDLDNQALDVIERPMRVLVLGLGVAIVAGLFDFGADLESFSSSISQALVIAALIFFVYNLVDVIGLNTSTVQSVIGISIEERLLPFIRTLFKMVIVVMGTMIILQEFGYDVTGLVASFGVVGLAFSLAAKDTAANIFGFTAIVSDNPFQVGDYIVTDSFSGVVEHVGVRSTRVRKLDQALVTVPNSQLTDAAVTNWSRLVKRRLDFYIGLTYDTTPTQMRDVLQQLRDMLKARESVDSESVIVHFVEFADSSLNIRIIAYLLLADWGEYTAEVEQINLEIMEIVAHLGLGFAFPSQSIYIETPQETPAAKAHSSTVRIQRADQVLPEHEIGQSEEMYQDNPSASSGDDGNAD